MSQSNNKLSAKPETLHKIQTSTQSTENHNGLRKEPDMSKRPVTSVVPKHRQEVLKWNGWGYNDSKFMVNEDGLLCFTGNRYPIGELTLPYFTEWVKTVFNVDLSTMNKPQPLPSPDKYPTPRIDSATIKRFEDLNLSISLQGVDRLVRSHGHTLHDIYILRESFFNRIPDLVVWPTSHSDVTKIVALANELNLVIIPFGGGTSVSGAVSCPDNELRPIISLDTSQMNSMISLDKENLAATFEAGIIGQDLERVLQEKGYTSGHEPDSYEFSSLGGWVATRASGMKKNIYGNIEDLVLHVKMVTPEGTLSKSTQVPRMSCGPDFNHVILGSEGTLGVVTEVTIKIRPLPKCKKYGSIVFPNWDAGVKCMREVARQRCQPASIRLMDNVQFQFGQTLRPVPGYFGLLLDGLKKVYITKIKGFNPSQMCVTTLLFEGDENDVIAQEKKIYGIAAQSGGIPAGQKNGERGYCLTFVIAYIRDLGLEYRVTAESFETSVPWDRTSSLVQNVKHRLAEECKKLNITHYMISSRLTQTYDSGCCIYFYFGFNYSNFNNPVEVYEILENHARDEIVASGGSISHHHGVGKLRKKWYPASVSAVGVNLYKTTKNALDPQNIFACNNFIQSNL